MAPEQHTAARDDGAPTDAPVSVTNDRPAPRVKAPHACPALATVGGNGSSRPIGLKLSGSVKVHRNPHLLIPLAVLCVFAIFFVGWEIVERHLFPTMSIGFRHAALTVRAGVATAFAGGVVYLLMRRQEQRLSTTAGQIARLLASYRADPAKPKRFENPHLVHCCDVFDCDSPECPMYDRRGERCWQVMALQNGFQEGRDLPVAIEQCQKCAVYRLSCPDKLTELGESFNNLMFLLESESARVGRMRAEMVEKEKMVALGQIAAGIAHEIGNPLSSISSVVQMLKRTRATEVGTGQLDLIETHIQRISAIVRQLASLARPGPDRWEQVDLAHILSEAVRLISFDRRARDVNIEFEPPGSLPMTYAVGGQLQQVFINLFLNALDAMPGGGGLTIRVAKRSRNIIVTVDDTGCGIPSDVGLRVFEPFFTTKEPGKGTGLGLAVSYSIVQKHGGSIDFSSAPGAGTTFTVRIPILDRPPEEA